MPKHSRRVQRHLDNLDLDSENHTSHFSINIRGIEWHSLCEPEGQISHYQVFNLHKMRSIKKHAITLSLQRNMNKISGQFRQIARTFEPSIKTPHDLGFRV